MIYMGVACCIKSLKPLKIKGEMGQIQNLQKIVDKSKIL